MNVAAVLARIRKMGACQERYDAFLFNCEHAVSQALSGRRESAQLQGAGALAALFLVLAIVSRALDSPNKCSNIVRTS